MKYLSCLLLAALLAAGTAARAEAPRAHPRVVLVIHGGAGDRSAAHTPERERELRRTLEQALRAGQAVLSKREGTSLDAVEAAIRVLEDSPLFNAGKGAVFTHDGRNELDASIMEGKEKRAGAVAAVTRLKNPITAARAVMENSRHVLLVGEGAHAFARAQGLELVDPKYFWTQQRWDELQKALRKEKEAEKRRTPGQARAAWPRYLGTVGAVARDRHGNLAAGTSTGGMTNKRFGRVGDSPIIGAGTYADNEACGVSCTGHGEFFIRYAVAHEVVALMRLKGLPVQQAAETVVQGQLKKAGGEGGLIALDARGNLAVSFNSQRMYRAYLTEDGKMHVFLGGRGE